MMVTLKGEKRTQQTFFLHGLTCSGDSRHSPRYLPRTRRKRMWKSHQTAKRGMTGQSVPWEREALRAWNQCDAEDQSRQHLN